MTGASPTTQSGLGKQQKKDNMKTTNELLEIDEVTGYNAAVHNESEEDDAEELYTVIQTTTGGLEIGDV